VASIDQVIVFDGKRDADALRAADADAAVLLPNSFASAWLVRRAGIPERWGYGTDWRGPLLTRAIRRPKEACIKVPTTSTSCTPLVSRADHWSRH
jgi:ADP-heptose:LPS heptosyltransferase